MDPKTPLWGRGCTYLKSAKAEGSMDRGPRLTVATRYQELAIAPGVPSRKPHAKKAAKTATFFLLGQLR